MLLSNNEPLRYIKQHRHSACPNAIDGERSKPIARGSLSLGHAPTFHPPRKHLRAYTKNSRTQTQLVQTMDKGTQVKQISQRHTALAWWARVHSAYPLGVVPIPTAARILAVTPTRIHTLIKEGRLTVVEGMPGGNERDRFIPIVDLFDAPFAMTRGKPGTFGPKNRYTGKKLRDQIDYANSNAHKGLRKP